MNIYRNDVYTLHMRETWEFKWSGCHFGTCAYKTSSCTGLYRVRVVADTLKRRCYVTKKGDLRHAYAPTKVVRHIVFNIHKTNIQMDTW